MNSLRRVAASASPGVQNSAKPLAQSGFVGRSPQSSRRSLFTLPVQAAKRGTGFSGFGSPAAKQALEKGV